MKSVPAQLCSSHTRDRMPLDNDWTEQASVGWDLGGVMAEATRRGLAGQNRHRSDQDKRRRPD